MKLNNRVLIIDGEQQNTDEILSIYSLGENAVGLQNYFTNESYRYTENLQNVYETLRRGGCESFFKIEDVIINLIYIDSLCIQTHPLIKNTKGAYTLTVKVKDGSNFRFGFDSHIDAERYLQAAESSMSYIQEKCDNVND